MNIHLKYLLVIISFLLIQGCANPLHYGWSYKPLHNPKSQLFVQPKGDIIYKEVNDMVKAEYEMHSDGYVMIGYCYMDSPQFDFIGVGGSKKWGKKIGATAVAHKYGNSRFLATYWAKPKTFILGAYYQDFVRQAGSPDAFKNGVLVINVVKESPAFKAQLAPGDVLLYLNGNAIESVESLNSMLGYYEGEEVDLVLWPYKSDRPTSVKIALNKLSPNV